MIDVKVIKKPKNEGSASALNTGGNAYGGMAVKEAAHAARADIAEMAKEATHSKESDHAQEGDHSLKADWASEADEAKHAKDADHAKEADNADKWDSRQFDDYLDQPVRKTDGVAFGSVITDSVRSAGEFVDGLLGAGFQLWKDGNGRALLTIDKLTVRQTMNVMELLIEKVRSVGGQICVSAANGKIKAVEEQDDYYLITFEQENTFVAHDLVRCHTFTGGDIHDYWVEVAEATTKGISVAKSEFDGVEPKAGDDCVLMGNTENVNRQNLILVSATEDGQPRVDVMDGVCAKTFDGALRARLGDLDDIKDDRFPAKNQPKGNGLYADNAYLKGTFVLETGEDVKTRFEIAEGKVQSAIDSVRNDFLSEKGYLSNPTFTSGLDKWNAENETVFFLVGNKWVWANGRVLSKKGDGASVVTDMGRTVVRIRNKYILQTHQNLRFVPAFPTNDEGQKEVLPVYLAFFYRCAKAGTLKVRFENVDKTGFADFNSLEVTEAIAETDGYVQYTCSGLWNGTGDFRLEFDGDIYLYMLVLSTDKYEALTHRYRTLFEQSERLVKISAAVFDKDDNALRETGLMVQPEGTGIYVKDASGKLALIGVGVEETDSDGNTKTVVKLTADNIKLEGLVTANGYFKVRSDGSIEARGGTFRGSVYADNGTIGGFNISQGHIGAASVKYNEDGTIEVNETNNGLFLYDSMIGFNDTDRQAIFGTWNNYGQPMLCRIIDTAKEYGFDVGITPKYGIVFDIENSASGNFAFAGKGSGVLNGVMEGFSFDKIELDTENTVFSGYMKLKQANRFLVKATKDKTIIALPNISQVRDGLAIGDTTPFCMRVTIIADLGSKNFHVCGRYSQKDSKDQYPWNTENLPVMVHWNGAQYETYEMGTGDTLEVLLVYDPSSTETLNNWPTKYTARIINKLS